MPKFISAYTTLLLTSLVASAFGCVTSLEIPDTPDVGGGFADAGTPMPRAVFDGPAIGEEFALEEQALGPDSVRSPSLACGADECLVAWRNARGVFATRTNGEGLPSEDAPILIASSPEQSIVVWDGSSLPSNAGPWVLRRVSGGYVVVFAGPAIGGFSALTTKLYAVMVGDNLATSLPFALAGDLRVDQATQVVVSPFYRDEEGNERFAVLLDSAENIQLVRFGLSNDLSAPTGTAIQYGLALQPVIQGRLPGALRLIIDSFGRPIIVYLREHEGTTRLGAWPITHDGSLSVDEAAEHPVERVVGSRLPSQTQVLLTGVDMTHNRAVLVWPEQSATPSMFDVHAVGFDLATLQFDESSRVLLSTGYLTSTLQMPSITGHRGKFVMPLAWLQSDNSAIRFDSSAGFSEPELVPHPEWAPTFYVHAMAVTDEGQLVAVCQKLDHLGDLSLTMPLQGLTVEDAALHVLMGKRVAQKSPQLACEETTCTFSWNADRTTRARRLRVEDGAFSAPVMIEPRQYATRTDRAMADISERTTWFGWGANGVTAQSWDKENGEPGQSSVLVHLVQPESDYSPWAGTILAAVAHNESYRVAVYFGGQLHVLTVRPSDLSVQSDQAVNLPDGVLDGWGVQVAGQSVFVVRTGVTNAAVPSVPLGTFQLVYEDTAGVLRAAPLPLNTTNASRALCPTCRLYAVAGGREFGTIFFAQPEPNLQGETVVRAAQFSQNGELLGQPEIALTLRGWVDSLNLAQTDNQIVLLTREFDSDFKIWAHSFVRSESSYVHERSLLLASDLFGQSYGEGVAAVRDGWFAATYTRGGDSVKSREGGSWTYLTENHGAQAVGRLFYLPPGTMDLE